MRRLLLCTLLPAFTSCGDPGTAADRLVFSAIPNRDATLLRRRYEPVARYLSAALGVAVEYQASTRYPDTVEQFKNGDVHLAWFGGLTGVQARHAVPGARAIAQGEADPRYYSYFIAHADTGLERGDGFPHAIAGKTFTFGADDSTSGRLMPEHFIRKYTGKAPRELFGHPDRFSGTHDATCEQVASGQVQVGAVDHKTYDNRVTEGKTDPAVCRVIWKSDLYPDYNFTAHPTLEAAFGEGFIDKVQQALLDMPTELVKNFDRDKFIPATNADFATIRDIAQQLEFIR